MGSQLQPCGKPPLDSLEKIEGRLLAQIEGGTVRVPAGEDTESVLQARVREVVKDIDYGMVSNIFGFTILKDSIEESHRQVHWRRPEVVRRTRWSAILPSRAAIASSPITRASQSAFLCGVAAKRAAVGDVRGGPPLAEAEAARVPPARRGTRTDVGPSVPVPCRGRQIAPVHAARGGGFTAPDNPLSASDGAGRRSVAGDLPPRPPSPFVRARSGVPEPIPRRRGGGGCNGRRYDVVGEGS